MVGPGWPISAAALPTAVEVRLLPICAYCKNIRDDGVLWQSIERYIASRFDAQFIRSIGPECRARLVTPLIEKRRRERETP